MHVYLVADYGTGDLAWAEVEAALRRECEARSFSRVSVPAFDTFAAALCLYQLAQSAGADDLVYHNIAPRRDQTESRQNNDGESLLFGQTEQGTIFVGPDSGSSWSLVYPRLASFHVVECASDGSQFRSRDIFPKATRSLLQGKLIGPPASEPDPIAEGVVLATDGYGNIKTSWRNPGVVGEIRICIGNFSVNARSQESSFATREGEIAWAPGSSDGFYEIFLRGGSAATHLGSPAGGDRVEIKARGAHTL